MQVVHVNILSLSFRSIFVVNLISPHLKVNLTKTVFVNTAGRVLKFNFSVLVQAQPHRGRCFVDS